MSSRRLDSPAEVHPRIGPLLRLGLAFASLQHADDSAQVLPSRLVQRRVGTDQIANHVPGRNVQSALRRKPQCQRDGALRAENNTLRRRFLPRLDSHCLSEHVDGYEFSPRFKLAITAQTMHILQGVFPGPISANEIRLLSPNSYLGRKYVEGFPQETGRQGHRRADRKRRVNWTALDPGQIAFHEPFSQWRPGFQVLLALEIRPVRRAHTC